MAMDQTEGYLRYLQEFVEAFDKNKSIGMENETWKLLTSKVFAHIYMTGSYEVLVNTRG